MRPIVQHKMNAAVAARTLPLCVVGRNFKLRDIIARLHKRGNTAGCKKMDIWSEASCIMAKG